jgi:hypothetical protein
VSKRVVEFWTVWGDSPLVCTRHRTLRNAVREALRCERTGGSEHNIVQVVRLGSTQTLKRKGRP